SGRRASAPSPPISRKAGSTAPPIRAAPGGRWVGETLEALAQEHVDVVLGPTLELRDPLEAGLLVHSGRLEVVSRDPDPANAPLLRLLDEGVEQRLRMPAASVCLFDPHLLDLGNAGPGVAGHGADQFPALVAN